METSNMNPGSSPSQGPVIGVIIVIIVLLVGAFYFLGRLAPGANPIDNLTGDETEQQGTTSEETMAPLSESDEISDIEADLNAEDFNDIDAELQTL